MGSKIKIGLEKLKISPTPKTAFAELFPKSEARFVTFARSKVSNSNFYIIVVAVEMILASTKKEPDLSSNMI